MANEDACPHEAFAARVEVCRIADDNDPRRVRSFIADVTVSCTTCGTPFHFVGADAGLSFTRPMVNFGATTLHAPIAPGEAPLPSRMRVEVS